MADLRRSSFLLPSTFAVLASAGALSAQDAERHSLAGDAVAIYNLAGSVSVEPGAGANVVVEVRRGGADAARLQVERREVGGRSALVIRYPEGDVVYRSGRWSGSSSLDVRDDGTFFGEARGGRRVTVRGSGRGTEAHADLRVLVPAGRTVDVRLGVGDVQAAGVAGDLDIDAGTAAVQTSRTRGRLRVDTGSGAVRVTDAEGDVSIDTGSGAVTVNGMRGDALQVDTGSGAVTGSGIGAGRVLVDTGSGRVALTGVAARELELDTGSGSVEVELTTDIDRLSIDTGSGSVRVAVPDELGASLDLESGSGGVSSDAPVTITRRERDRLVGTIGDGRGSIEIDTGSGSVRIVRRQS